MKALEIFKNVSSINGFRELQLVISKDKLDEAIKELEDIQNKSCVTCRYGQSFHFDKDIECMKLYDATQGLCFEKDFYCKNWESK